MQSLLLWGVWGNQSTASLCDWWTDKAFGMFGKKERRRKREREEAKKDKDSSADNVHGTHVHIIHTDVNIWKRKRDLSGEQFCLNAHSYTQQACQQATVQAFWIIYEISQYRNQVIKQFQTPVTNFTLLILFALTLMSILHSSSVFQSRKCSNRLSEQN